jgi:preprotein translocase subunit SecA
MSNAAALLKTRRIELADNACMERAERREGAFEEFLERLVAHVPRPRWQRRRLRRFVAAVNAAESSLQLLATDELAGVLRGAGRELRSTGFRDGPTARAFAVVREASRRTLGMRHHDVQLIGGWALLQGRIAEMATGEGKTLVATLAAATAAATGAAVHVVTVNDYLADRDAKGNAPLFACLGLSVGAVAQSMRPDERRTQYARDVVYVSNKELVFDYLKDRLSGGATPASRLRLRRVYKDVRPPAMLLRGLHVAIVDEADSVLIDEARTPLIISETLAPSGGGELFRTAIDLARRMRRGEHFVLSQHRDIWVTPAGEQMAESAAATLGGVWSSATWRSELVDKALSALWCFDRDQHYIVVDNKVQIVDEFTGRVMPDRSWERGLHQMIEAKENCEITGERRTLSRMTYQRFFRRYLLLGGMTGTAAEVATELRRVYELDVLRIPTHKPPRRRRLADRCWPAAEQRWRAVAERAIELAGEGRAILIGTRSVEASEQLAALLSEHGAPHRVLNARQDAAEAEIVAGAGEPGQITVATNMAGRGTDIRLGADVSKRGGLHVILTEFHESARVDRQLFGRCARQGEPGSVEAMVCLDDDLFKRHAPTGRRIVRAAARQGAATRLSLRLLIRLAQRSAERHNARIRLATLKQDRNLQAMLAFSGDPN